MPDSVDTDVSGIMVSDDKSCITIDKYLRSNYRAFGDYFILTERIVGIRQSDGQAFHPLIEIHDWQHIDAIVFWLILMAGLVCLAIFVRSTKRYLTSIKHSRTRS